jgi:hypothetical protein
MLTMDDMVDGLVGAGPVGGDEDMTRRGGERSGKEG